jgi:uncharacterized protein YndB with AHSA1/START domain
MANLHFTIHINAPREKVWATMLEDESYREWTSVFMPGSYYEGDWSEGSKMRFLGPHPENGKVSGMAAIVKENRPNEFISLEHYAEIHEDVEQVWAQTGFENYTFMEAEDGTDVIVDMLNVPDEYAPMFEEIWPGSLQKLKEITEA